MDAGEGRVAEKRPRYECLLFDLDDTLYPLSSGLAAECRKNIQDYMVEKLGIEESKVPDLAVSLYRDYGTTMAGLRAIGYNFDYDDYHSFVHGKLPYENLRPDAVLRSLLLSMPQRKIIFTNGDRVHAAKVLSRLALEDCFEGVICFETLNSPSQTTDYCNGFDTDYCNGFDTDYCNGSDTASGDLTYPKTPIVCKPSPEAIKHALSIANADPQRTIFFDDSVRNIAAGKRSGLHTVLVGTSIRTDGADFALESIHNIREALPEIWEDEKSEKVVRSRGRVSIETVVTA